MFKKVLEKRESLQKRRDWSTRRRYLENNRLPPLIPHFTERGFAIFDLPEDLCDFVTQFWKDGKQMDNLKEETHENGATQINGDFFIIL